MAIKNLKIPIHKQGKSASCCAAYSLKSICDFYKIPTTKNSLIKKCKVTKNSGASISDTISCGESLGLQFKEMSPADTPKEFHKSIKKSLKNGHPVVISLQAGNAWHLCVIKGYDDLCYYFSDSRLGSHKRHQGETRILSRYSYSVIY